jgi:hypothetical protein
VIARPLIARFGRKIVVGIGALADMIGFTLVFINLPDASVFGESSGPTFIESQYVYVTVAKFYRYTLVNVLISVI